MEEILARVGPADYTYGSTWCREPAREELLERIDGVSLVSVVPYELDVIEFANLSSFDEYKRMISESHRRNIRTAERHLNRIRVRKLRGRSALGLVLPMTRLRGETFRAKGIPFKFTRALLNLAGKLIALGDSAFISILTLDAQAFSGVVGADFGTSTTYVHGGNRRSQLGLSPYLMLETIRRAYEQHPSGSFIMGFSRRRAAGDETPEPHREFRRYFRAQPMSGSVVSFRYRGRG
jgi:hypothetical protein